MTSSAGVRVERSLYRPYGNWGTNLTWQFAALAQEKSHGYIGERLDADAGLLYLNARYMDPKLGMFTQPDWWEVTKPGVGTNRYAYAGGDPVNGMDPGGNDTYLIVDPSGFVGQHTGLVVYIGRGKSAAVYDSSGSFEYVESEKKIIGGDKLEFGSGRLLETEDGSVETNRGRIIGIEGIIDQYVDNFDEAQREEGSDPATVKIYRLGTTKEEEKRIIETARDLGDGTLVCTINTATAVGAVGNFKDIYSWTPKGLDGYLDNKKSTTGVTLVPRITIGSASE